MLSSAHRALLAVDGIKMGIVRARSKAKRQKEKEVRTEVRIENSVAALNGTSGYHVCGGCMDLVLVTDRHTRRTCPKVKKVLEGERHMHYALQEQLSRRERQRLRFVIGDGIQSEEAFLVIRDKKWEEIAAIAPYHLDPIDNTSVWCRYDQSLLWLCQVRNSTLTLLAAVVLLCSQVLNSRVIVAQLSHIMEMLPPMAARKVMTLGIMLTNDATPLHGRLSKRQCHSMLMRLDLADAAGREDCMAIVALAAWGESAKFQKQMYVDNQEFHMSFSRLPAAARQLGYKDSLIMIPVDGAAMV